VIHILNSIPSPSVNDITIGSVTIRYYALFIILGIVLAIVISALRLKNRGATAGDAVDIAIWAVPFGIIGGRFYHVITHLNDYFGPGIDPVTVFYIWNGGLAIFGAILFGSLGAWIGARQAGVSFLAYTDALVPGLLLAQAVGRLGNYFNQELFGVPTDLPWGLEIDPGNAAWPVGLPQGTTFHPTFLYEILWNLVGIGVLILVERHFKLQWGKLFASYLIYYSFGRALIEMIRIDPAYVFLGLRTNVWSAIAGLVAGLALLWWLNRRHPGIQLSILSQKRIEADSSKNVVSAANPDNESNVSEAEIEPYELDSKSE
jgi:prolipoprotein diacylglyceryl transferase